ncbi:MAG TPA: SIMPL domain-containing protein [Candidatus Tumulicola sp.]
MSVRLTPALVPQAIRALQGISTLNDARIALQIRPAYSVRRAGRVETNAYTAALDDARAKAKAIAAYARVTLGRVQSVTEMSPLTSLPGYVGAGRLAPVPQIRARGVTAPNNGVVTLAVTFNAGNVPISVFGVHAGPIPEDNLSDATGLSVDIRAGGESLSATQRRVSSIEDSIRSIVAHYGATPKDIVITTADVNTF